MIRRIVLDSAPLSGLCLPTRGTELTAIVNWSQACLEAGHSLYIPEIVDYELCRELLRARKSENLTRLDGLKSPLIYVPLTTECMLRAAELWAFARSSGIPTTDPKRLDVDVILAAQALTIPASHAEVVVATSNVGHLSRFVPAFEWSRISP